MYSRVLSIRTAILVLLLVVLVPALLVQAFVYYRWYSASLAVEQHANREMARAVSMGFRGYVRAIRRQEETLAMAIRQLNPTCNEQIDDLLRHFTDEYPSIRAVHWINPQGLIIGSSARAGIGRRVADQPYFRVLLEGGTDWVLSNLLLEPVTGELSFVIASRIKTDGRLAGVLVAAIDPRRVTTILDLGHEGQVALAVFDTRGVLVLRDPAVQLTLESRSGSDTLLLKALGGQEAIGDIPHSVDGEQRFGARVPIDGLGWVAGASQPRDAALKPVLIPLQVTLGLMFLTIAVSGVVATVIGGSIVVDIRRLKEHAQAIGSGDVEHPAATAHIAEMHQLAEAFNESVARRRQAEEAREQVLRELRTAHCELEERVVQRTAQLQAAVEALRREADARARSEDARSQLKEQLHQSEKMAAIGRLATGLGHDFGNILATIAGYSSKAREVARQSSAVLQALAVVDEAARQAHGIVDALLAFGGKPAGRKIPVALNAVLEESAYLLRHTLSSRIDFCCYPGPMPLWVRADPLQIEQILLNLAVNARDAMPEGGILEMRLQPAPHPSSAGQATTSAILTIRDTGPGISPEVLPHIFEPFFTTKHSDGSGLGLSIVHGIVEDLHGTIEVHTQAGQGTTFVIQLPCIEPPSPQESCREISPLPGVEGRVALLAGGSARTRGLIGANLRLLGFEVVQTPDDTAMAARLDEYGNQVALIVLQTDAPGEHFENPLARPGPFGSRAPVVLIRCGTARDAGDAAYPPHVVPLTEPCGLPELTAAVCAALRIPRPGEVA